VHLKYFCGETSRRTAAQSRQRRSSDHPQERGNKRRAPAINREKKKWFTKSGSKPSVKKRKVAQKSKKVFRATSTKGYESDSDLSLPDDFDVTSKRPSRSAAKAAAQRLTASSKDWIGRDTSDSDEFLDDSHLPSDDESSDESSAPTCTIIGTKERGTDDPSSDSDSESDDRSASLIRSRQRQQRALSMVKKNMKKGHNSKKMEKESHGKVFGRKKKIGKNLNSDERANKNDDDPLNGIDMSELKAKAMQGCQPSVLHTISWWRIVLDEAHNIK
jgi:hypothetical protein